MEVNNTDTAVSIFSNYSSKGYRADIIWKKVMYEAKKN